jgi:hypothetical protein
LRRRDEASMMIAGRKLRAAMPFLDPVTVEEVAKNR